MDKQCLDVQQMQHLQELGLELKKDTILVWARFMLGKTQISDWEIAYNHSAITDNSQTIPAYTLQDVQDVLVSASDGSVDIAHYLSPTNTWWAKDGNIIAPKCWMPIPKMTTD